MEQLAHFVTKSFEYNNNRVLDVINMSTRSLICDSLRSANKTLDRLSSASASTANATAAAANGTSASAAKLARMTGDSGAVEHQPTVEDYDADGDSTMDIDITDISSDEDDTVDDNVVVAVGRKEGRPMTITNKPALSSNRAATPPAIRSQAKSPSPPHQQSSNTDDALLSLASSETRQRRLTTKNWLISDSPKRCADISIAPGSTTSAACEAAAPFEDADNDVALNLIRVDHTTGQPIVEAAVGHPPRFTAADAADAAAAAAVVASAAAVHQLQQHYHQQHHQHLMQQQYQHQHPHHHHHHHHPQHHILQPHDSLQPHLLPNALHHHQHHPFDHQRSRSPSSPDRTSIKSEDGATKPTALSEPIATHNNNSSHINNNINSTHNNTSSSSCGGSIPDDDCDIHLPVGADATAAASATSGAAAVGLAGEHIKP